MPPLSLCADSSFVSRTKYEGPGHKCQVLFANTDTHVFGFTMPTRVHAPCGICVPQVSAKAALEERDDRYMRLLAKHTLQSGITNKTATLNEELKRENEQLAKVDHHPNH